MSALYPTLRSQPLQSPRPVTVDCFRPTHATVHSKQLGEATSVLWEWVYSQNTGCQQQQPSAL